MGYQTSFSIQVSQYAPDMEKEVKVEDLIDDIKSGKKMTKTILLEKLEEIAKPRKPKLAAQDIIRALIRENTNAAYAITEMGYSKAELVWFDHENELKDFSAKYPDWLITLSFEGDEPHEIYKKYFLNGKVQVEKARIIIDEFNPSKLV